VAVFYGPHRRIDAFRLSLELEDDPDPWLLENLDFFAYSAGFTGGVRVAAGT
jgi:hypothetical protein